MISEAPPFHLDSDWTPIDGETGTLTLRLSNRSNRPLRNFRLGFTSHVRLQPEGELWGASLVQQLSGYHLIAPPGGFVLMPGASWSVTAHRLDYAPRHYTAGLKSAYLVLEDGALVTVASTPTTRGHQIGSPRLRAPAPPRLPRGALPLAILPFPLNINIGGRRETIGALHLMQGPPEAQLAFHAAAALAKRLFRSEPELFGGAGRIACMAARDKIDEEGYRIEFRENVVTLFASGRSGFFYGFVTLGQILQGAQKEPDQFVFPTGEIIDGPRFAWRGMLLDVARQVYQPEYLIRLLDHLAWRKLNRLQLHLSDDEGWRLDIPGYPQLD